MYKVGQIFYQAKREGYVCIKSFWEQFGIHKWKLQNGMPSLKI
jgi:hypothetical protein